VGIVADLDGNVVTGAQNKDAKPRNEPLKASIALAEVRAANKSIMTVEAFGDEFYSVAAIPIQRYGVQTLGYLVVAAVFDKALLDQLKTASGADILLVQDGVVRAGSATLERGADKLKAVTEHLKPSEKFLPVNGLVAAGGASLLGWANPIVAGDKVQGAVLLALSAKENSRLQRELLGSSLMFTLVITFIAGLMGLLIARRIADPIVEIEYSFREIAASGDLSRRIDKPYKDEVGLMAQSFNQMQHHIEQLHTRVLAAEQRMRDELKTAAAVQEMLFPSTAIDGARCQFASHSQASSETGGDWYTIIHSPRQQVTTVIVSDVTGHGAAAALVTAIFHGFFKATEEEISNLTEANWKAGIDTILKRLNRALIESTRRALVSSLFLLTFDHRTMRARYVNAGHLAPILVQSTKGKNQVGILATAPSALIGDVDDPGFSWGEHQFQPEQLFMLYTDGLVECTNANHEMYGFKRLRVLLEKVGHQDARTVRDRIISNALEFFGDMTHADDITIIVGRTR
jgi:serine phosphatase RsbU (regulator of sigma subunit)